MLITIIKSDGVVAVDRVARKVDLSALPAGIAAVQFDTVSGEGTVEYDHTATVGVQVRDFDAEAMAEAEAGNDREKQQKLQPIYRTVQAPRPPSRVTPALTAQLQTFVDAWIAAAPPPPDPAAVSAAELEAKRAAALRALDDARLQAAALDPGAPQAVKDYAAAKRN